MFMPALTMPVNPPNAKTTPARDIPVKAGSRQERLKPVEVAVAAALAGPVFHARDDGERC